MEAFVARPCQHARQAVWSEQILSRHALKAIAQGAKHVAGDPHTALCCMTCGARSSPWARAEQRRCGHQLALDMQRLELYCLVCGDYQFCQDFDHVLTAAKVRLQPPGRAQQLAVAANDPAANVIVTRQRAASQSRGTTPSTAAPTQAPPAAQAPGPAAAAAARAAQGSRSGAAAWGAPGAAPQQQLVPVDTHPQGLRGLNNLGHTCFMNCVLQVLLHAPLLRHFYLGEGHHPAACRAAAKDRPCLSCQMDTIFADMYSGSRSPLSPTEFLYQWWRYAEPMANYDQQDAHEFYLSLLEGLAGSRITPPGGGSSSSNAEGVKEEAAAAAGGSGQQQRPTGAGGSRTEGVSSASQNPVAAGGGVAGQGAAAGHPPSRHLWQQEQQQQAAAAAAGAAPSASSWPVSHTSFPSDPQRPQAGGTHSIYSQHPQLPQQQPTAGAAAAPAAVNGLLPNGMRPAIPLQLHVAGCSQLGSGSSTFMPLTGPAAAAGGVGGLGAGRATTPEVLVVGGRECGTAQPSPSPEPVGASLVDTALQGLLQSDVVCRECGHTSSTFDPFRDISLDLHVPRLPRYPPRLGAHPLALRGPLGTAPDARLTPTEGFTPSPTPPPSELRLGPAAVEEGPEGLTGATPAVSSSSGPSREGCSEWVSGAAASEGGARRSELASAAWTPELAGKSCASQSSGLAGLATSQASQPGGVAGGGGGDPDTRATTPGLSDARGGACLDSQGGQEEADEEEGDGAEPSAAAGVAASTGREYTPSSHLIEGSPDPAAGAMQGVPPGDNHQQQQQAAAGGTAAGAAASAPVVCPPISAAAAEGGALRTLSGSLSALLKPATEVLQQLLMAPGRPGSGQEGQGAAPATQPPTQQQQQKECMGMAAAGSGEGTGAGRGTKRRSSDMGEGGDTGAAAAAAAAAAGEPPAKMLRRRSQDGTAVTTNTLAAPQQQQQVGLLAAAPPVAMAVTAASAGLSGSCPGLQPQAPLQLHQRQQQHVGGMAAAEMGPAGAAAGPMLKAPGAPSVRGGKGGRKGGGGGAHKPPKAPRVQRCGQCHTCLHRHLKKGCMRNREQKEAAAGTGTAEGVDVGGPQSSAPGALEHPAGGAGALGAAAGAGSWRASSAPAGEDSGLLRSNTGTPQPSAAVGAELAAVAGYGAGGLAPAAAPAARAGAGTGGGRGHSPAVKKEATPKLAAAMKREQRVMAALEPASLLGCLHRFVRPEQLSCPSSWRCERCSVVGQGTKQMSFRRLPPVLCFHIKRFEHGGPGMVGGGGRARKLDVPLRFPVGELDMRPFLSSCLYQQRWGLRCSGAAAAAPSMHACGAAGGTDAGVKEEPQQPQSQPRPPPPEQPQQQPVKPDPQPPHQPPQGEGGQAGSGGGTSSSNSSSGGGHDFLYRLFGVVSHRGDMQGGHYVSYVRCNSSWYLCDDASIYPADESEVAACQAYMLFYASSRYWAADRAGDDLRVAAGALAAAVAEAAAGAAIKQEGLQGGA